MFTVKRAIIMAAGKGNRLQPITLDIPKPLIKVNGIRMIETVINALHKNGIFEIHIVVGYLKEQFNYLIERYPGVHIIENTYYDTCNNISSLYVAREFISESVIIDGDQIIYNEDILETSFEKSGYNAVWTETETNEWLMQVENDRVYSCSRTGGSKGWQLYSISRWSKEDGKKLKEHLELEFEINHRNQLYWDDVVMFCHFDEYNLGIKEMVYSDIVEIDSLVELATIDHSYAKFVGEQ